MQIAVFFTEDELLNEHTLLYRAESIKENEIQAVKDYASTLFELYKQGWKLNSVTNPEGLKHIFFMELNQPL